MFIEAETGTHPQTRKRKRPLEKPSPSVNKHWDQPSSKKQKQEQPHRSRSVTPASFWDNLSRLPLCRRALREFNRRVEPPKAEAPPARVTLQPDLVKNLKRFARRGGPDLSNVKGNYEHAKYTMQSRKPSSARSQASAGPALSSASSRSGRKSKLSSKDPAFAQALQDAGFYLYNNETLPLNLEDEIKERLARPRASLSPSRFTRDDFEKFRLRNQEAFSEEAVKTNIFPTIMGGTSLPYGPNVRFNHLEDLCNDISSAQPDFYDGSRPIELDRLARDELGTRIVPCSDTSRPLLPNFFTEIKGPEGSATTVRRQMMQDLGLGARGMLAIRSYGQDDVDYDGNAYTLGATYLSASGDLDIYAMHPSAPVDHCSIAQYRLSEVESFRLTKNPSQLREGLTCFRNARDLAKEYRDVAIAQANEMAILRGNIASDIDVVDTVEQSAATGSVSQQTITQHTSNHASQTNEDTETSLEDNDFRLSPQVVTAQSQSRKRQANQDSTQARKRGTAAPMNELD